MYHEYNLTILSLKGKIISIKQNFYRQYFLAPKEHINKNRSIYWLLATKLNITPLDKNEVIGRTGVDRIECRLQSQETGKEGQGLTQVSPCALSLDTSCPHLWTPALLY